MDLPRLLVLRLWVAPSMPFRAVVRDVGPERTASFNDPEALWRYLLCDPMATQAATDLRGNDPPPDIAACVGPRT